MGTTNPLIASLTGLIYFLLTGFYLQAQEIEAPRLLCIKGDTLNWELPIVNCGPFIAYEIYASRDAEGPFDLLTALTNPLSTQFVHTNSPGLWYYYMVSDFDCPGWIAKSSDTLNNLPPQAPKIRKTTVDGSSVLLDWFPSPSKQVYAHIVYRATSQGTIPIDTVYLPELQYRDNGADVNNKEEFYYVLALDPCGNTSGFDQLQKTIFVSGTQDPCERTIFLEWSEYIGFMDGIEKYELRIFEDGELSSLSEISGDLGTGSIVTEIEQGVEYCMTVSAKENDSDEISFSNTLCLIGEARVPLTKFNYKAFSIAPDNLSIYLNWEYNENFEYEDFYANYGYILPLENSGEVLLLDPVSTPGFAEIVLPYSPNEKKPIHAYIAIRDICNRYSVQDTLTSLYLEVKEGEDGNNVLQWNQPIWPSAQLKKYEIYFQNENLLIDIAAPNQNTSLHGVEGKMGSEEGFCYNAIAHWEAQEDGETREYAWRSNTACLKRESIIFMANAIRPGGANPSIRPQIKFTESVESYQFMVFDRQGTLHFSTRDMNQEWAGTSKNGGSLGPGVYPYSIQVILQDGRKLNKQGTIALIR